MGTSTRDLKQSAMAATIDNFLHSFNTKFDGNVRSHLKNVYATLTMSVMAASAGAYVHLFTTLLQGGGLMFSLLGAGLALGLFMTPDNGKNRGMRMGMLLGFAFLTGLGLGPLLQLAIMMNPSIVPSALMITSGIFACSLELLCLHLMASISILVELSCLVSQLFSFLDLQTSFSGLSFSSRLICTSAWQFSVDLSCSTLK